MKALHAPLVLCLLLSPLALPAGAAVITHTYSFDAPTVELLQGQTVVILDGATTWGRVGAPLLPQAPIQLLLPPGEEAVSIEVRTAAPVSLGDGYRVSHRTAPYPLSQGSPSQPTPPDPAIYGRDDPYPAVAAGDLQTQFYAGHGLAYAAAFPVVYRPVSGELAYYPTITVTIETRPTARAQEAFGLLKHTPAAAQRLAGMIQNPEAGAAYGPVQPQRPDGWDMLVITPQSFTANYQPFVDYKNRSGIMTTVVTTEYIYANYTGSDNQAKIRNCIVDYYNTQDITYVLLAGDNEHIPHRGLRCVSGYTDNDIAADLYYSGLDGTWNNDGDNYWGEPGEEDFVAEVLIGRSCADNATEIANWVNKTLMYQTQPVQAELNTGLMVGEDLDWTIWAWEYMEEIRLGSSNWGYTTAGFPATMAVDTLYERPGYYWSAMTNLLPKLNLGPNLISHLGHGNTNYVMKFYTSNITDQNLTNNGTNHNFFIAYSQACYSGSWDNRSTGGSVGADCICETFTTIAHGAVAYVCNSRYGWGSGSTTDGPSQHFNRQFFDALFAENRPILGDMNGDSKEDCIWMVPSDNTIRWCYYELNLLGDPTIDVWTADPGEFAPVFNSTLLQGSQTFQVSGISLPGALATLSVDNVVMGKAAANSAGLAGIVFDQPLTQLGPMTLMITGHNMMPYQDTVQVIAASGPTVVLNSCQISDGPMGNNNGQWDYGETTDLSINLKNVGVGPATGVNAVLTTTDTMTTILDAVAAYGAINAGDSLTVANGFRVSVEGSVPDQYLVPFTLTATASPGGPWYSFFSLPVNAPMVVEAGVEIQDPGGLPANGQLDPGETTTLLLTLINQGHAAAQNVSVTLTANHPQVSVTGNPGSYGTLNPTAMATDSWTVTVGSGVPNTTPVTFTLAIATPGGYSGSDSFTLTVGDLRNIPSGPDMYGYRAWDNLDGGEGHPYDWVEIAPEAGGPGSNLALSPASDQTFSVPLPFTFRFYGADFTQISVCTNGWLALGSTTLTTAINTTIPSSAGPPNIVAAFWDNLTPQYGGSQLCTWSDPAQHRFIVEWYDLALYGSSAARQRFQVILWDPAYYPTAAGDGVILVQFHTVTSPNSATFGIENAAQTVGLQYGFNNTWHPCGWPVQSGRTITYTTDLPGAPPPVSVSLAPNGAPIQIPASGGSFSFDATLVNSLAIPAPVDAWIMQLTPGGSWQGPMLGPLNLTLPGNAVVARLRNQNVPGTAAAGIYTYRGYVGDYPGVKQDSSGFTYLKLSTGDGAWVEGWANWGQDFEPYLSGMETAALPQACDLLQNRPNPFNPMTAIGYRLPAPGYVSVRVYDTAGREVKTLVDGWREAGNHEVTFDGAGLASGLYFARMQAGDYTGVVKMLLVK
ncbi:MAG: hypothetical protein C4524_10350 [Candidatus Zixiibacteriota bacterium]|nr:MAG: hypothetical protein C4524_10350 [candidate division Zixibacteria bacterium]